MSGPSIKNMVIVLAFLYLLFSGNRGIWNLYKLHREKIILRQQIQLLDYQVNQYQNKYQELQKNPDLLEKQAREELDLVRPNEIVYKFNAAPAE